MVIVLPAGLVLENFHEGAPGELAVMLVGLLPEGDGAGVPEAEDIPYVRLWGAHSDSVLVRRYDLLKHPVLVPLRLAVLGKGHPEPYEIFGREGTRYLE